MPGIGVGIGLGMNKAQVGYPPIIDDGNTAAWYEALVEYMTLEDIFRIAQWDDKSGNNHHLLATLSRRAVWGDNVVEFDGINMYMRAAFTLVQPEFIYLVFKQVTWIHAHYLMDGYTSTNGKLQQLNPTPDLIVDAGAISGHESNLAVDTWGIARVLFNGASSKFIIDDNTPVTGNFGAKDMDGITFGAGGGGALPGNIHIKEAIIRKVADIAPNEAAIYNYLVNKYSI